MDSRNRHEKRRTAKIPRGKIGRNYTGEETGSGGKFQKSENQETRSISGNLKEATQEKIKKRGVFAPIKDELLVLVEYLNIMERKNLNAGKQEIISVLELVDIVRRKIEFYLNYQFIKAA